MPKKSTTKAGGSASKMANPAIRGRAGVPVFVDTSKTGRREIKLFGNGPPVPTLALRSMSAWIEILSAPVRAAVIEHAAGLGYGHELEQWIADTLSTAYRSPSGLILRLRRKTAEIPPEARPEVEELPLFSGAIEPDPPAGSSTRGGAS